MDGQAASKASAWTVIIAGRNARAQLANMQKLQKSVGFNVRSIPRVRPCDAGPADELGRPDMLRNALPHPSIAFILPFFRILPAAALLTAAIPSRPRFSDPPEERAGAAGLCTESA